MRRALSSFNRRFHPREPATAEEYEVHDVDAWLAIRTRSRFEKRVSDQLGQKSVEAFLPTITRWSRWRDRRKQISWPLFPGYCFARPSPDEYASMLRCVGVVNVVSFDGTPAPILATEIEAIRCLIESKLKFDPLPFIEEGDRVEVIAGPLRGVAGCLVKKGQTTRLILAVELLGRSVSVQVDSADVVRASWTDDRGAGGRLSARALPPPVRGQEHRL